MPDWLNPRKRKGMSKKLASRKIVRKSAADIAHASKADLERLHAAMKTPIDTSEIPERRVFKRIRRDEHGKLPSQRSMIRDAVAREMRAREITVYRLWQLAKTHYPPLSQAAVHEFLKGRRQLELPSVEALLAAVNLRIVRANIPNRKTPHK